MDITPLASEPSAEAAPQAEAAFTVEAAASYDAVMGFCLTRGQVLFTTLITEFSNIHLGDLERYVSLLCNVHGGVVCWHTERILCTPETEAPSASWRPLLAVFALTAL